MISLKERWSQGNTWVKLRLRRSRKSRRAVSRLNAEKRKLWWMQVLRFGSIGFLVLVVLGVISFFTLLAVYARDLPKPGEVVRQTGFSTRIFDRNGVLINDLFGEENRTYVTLDAIPQSLRDATVAIEDKDFYKHSGLDPLVFVRAPYYLLTEGRIVGGSTLTQQLVKKAVLTDDRSVERKFKQIVSSLLIERRFSKDQILEMYLNEVPYGGTAYGVGAAAELYFDKPVSELTLTESAILAGLPQRPTAYSPLFSKTDENGELLWQLRTRGVLRRMKEDGYITDAAYQQALSDLDLVEFSQRQTDLRAPHFVFYVRDQLEELFGADLVQAGGLQVTTTLDLELHDQVQTIVAEEIEKVVDLNITNGAAIVMQPETGEIISMVGSRGFNDEEIDGQFNVAVDGLRQPGSSIKPVVYATLLQQGKTPATMMIDTPTVFQRNDNERPYEPKNYDGKFRGPVSLRNSLGSSLNIPAVKSLAMVGLESFLSQAYAMGFKTLEPTQENLSRLGLSVALGGGEVYLLDSVTAYSAFANSGYRVEPVSILKVQDREGRVIFEHKPAQGQQVLQPEEAFLINDILSDDSARALAFGLNSRLNVGPNVAVKTGTTNDQRDNWAIGWSRDVLVGVWVGNNDNSPMKSVASGVSGATPIWQRAIQYALANGYEAPAWEVPAGIESASVNSISGYPAHDELPAREEQVIRGSLPALPDPIHQKLRLCKGQAKLATEAQIASGDYEEKEFVSLREEDPYSQDGRNRWQEGIDAWIAGTEGDRYRPPSEYCGDQESLFIKFERPENEKTFNQEEVEVRVEAGSGAGIEKMEIIADGRVLETVENREYQGKITLPAGRHTVWVKVYSRDGKTQESEKRKIGTGGVPWQEPTDTPQATATVAPPTATPTTAPAPINPTTTVAPPTATPTTSVVPTTDPPSPTPTEDD